jgi:hypothetical protein
MPVNGTKMAYKGLVHFCPAFSELTVNRFSGTLCLRDSERNFYAPLAINQEPYRRFKCEALNED